MIEMQASWIRDSRGRVGLVLPENRARFANGERRMPENCYEMRDHDLAAQLFEAQRDAMWASVKELLPVARRVLSRLGPRPGTSRHEEMLSDVGVPALCEACLLYNEGHEAQKPLKSFASMCLRREFVKALSREAAGRRESLRVSLQSIARNGPNYQPSTGLEDTDQLLQIVGRAGLTAEEKDVLHWYFVRGYSLREIAEHLGKSSPQTILDTVNRILRKCRKATAT